MKAVTIAGANLRRFLRDRSNVFFVFILPIGIVLLIGAQFGGDFSPRIGVVAPDDPLGSSVRSALADQPDLTVVEYEDQADLMRAVERGALSAGVVVPPELGSAIDAGGTGRVEFLSRPDGLGPQMQAVVAEAVALTSAEIDAARYVEDRGADSAAATAAAQAAAATIPGIEVSVTTAGESLFPASLGQFDLGASSQLVLFMFLTGLAGSAAVIQTRKLGVTTRMMSTPTSSWTIVAGEALGRFIIVLVQGLYIMAATILVFRVDWGDPLGAAAILVMFAVVAAGAALLFGTLFANDQQAGGVGVVAGLGLAALGGSMLPLELFSDTMQTVARFTPHAWANEAFADLVRRNGGVADIMAELAVLLAFGVVLLTLAAWRMRAIITRY